MQIARNEFVALCAIKDHPGLTQRDIADLTELSLGTINSAYKTITAKGLVKEKRITQRGLEALEPYKVDNAIIMAAGLSSRFAPISYEKPKGVLRVRGEILIERQIEQLLEADITDITVVVGYKKEEFFYLADKYGVNIVVNPLYSERNNYYTLWLVREKLGNTFICSSDDYFTENVFEPYVFGAYYAAAFSDEPSNEYFLRTGVRDQIVDVVTDGSMSGWYMLGHAYFDRAYSARFAEILESIAEQPETFGKLWEDIYAEHIPELPMCMRRYEEGILNEFDSLDELRRFDPAFIENVDSSILDNIAGVLECSRADINSIVPIKQGLTNMSFKFSVKGESFVYRHPGAGTDEIISRAAETQAEKLARKLGIDMTFIFEDAKAGWKISHFIDNASPLDYRNKTQVKKAMEIARKLHSCGETINSSFDVFEKAKQLVELLAERSRTGFADFDELFAAITRVHDNVVQDGIAPCPCHNDFYGPNYLVRDDEMFLIDWEYAGMSDYASDLGTFICCSDYTYDKAEQVIRWYFDRKPSSNELRHCIGYVALAAFYWFVWAIYKDSYGDPVGESLYTWYRFAKEYSRRALEMSES